MKNVIDAFSGKPHPPAGQGSSAEPCFKVTVIIIPSLSSSRQGLAGSWGQDTDQAGTFWGVLKCQLAPLALSSDIDQPKTMKNHKKNWNHEKHTWNHE